LGWVDVGGSRGTLTDVLASGAPPILSRVRRRPEGSSQSGQAAVEAALILPLMVFFMLGLVQMTMLQQARLMTDYAAFQAARTGVVWNGNHERMHDAAIVALLPTLGRTDSLLEVGKTWAFAQFYETALAAIAWGTPVPKTLNGSNLLGLVRIDTVNPAHFTPIDTLWNLRGGANWKELDFDGPGTFPQVRHLEAFIAKFFNLALPDNQEEIYRRSTVLQIRLRYWYELKVPFANHLIFLAWYAANAGVSLYGAVDRSSVTRQNMLGRAGTIGPLSALGKGYTSHKGYDNVDRTEMLVLWGLAMGSIPLVSGVVGRHDFIPLQSTHSMRMQSNFHRKWMMHQTPNWGL
jgi:TadE-like protein